MYEIEEVLNFIDPARCDYKEWCNIGMALKEGGYDVEVWEKWSMKDPGRYHPGECVKKWSTFNGSGTPVTVGTIVQIAKNNGFKPEMGGYALDWDSEIGGKFIDEKWLEKEEIPEPERWSPAEQIILYLDTLFKDDENVGYVVQSFEKDGKFIPANKGLYDLNAGELKKRLTLCKNDIGSVLGDYNPKAGAWVRFNPLDGKGVKDENITAYRYALVESDNDEIEKQNALIRELQLPVACLVYSGGKSLHAIVKIGASTREEYRKRVDYLFEICQKNGLLIDRSNRNPSRLSRLPGVVRGDKKQFIVDTNIGKKDFEEWKEYVESQNDDLPDSESLFDVWFKMPELSAPLINGVLRQGHKMLVSGPSKAGKSFALIELCCAIAEGKRWLSFDCAKGKVLYVNLELDRASCLHRFKDVYKASGWEFSNNARNIDIWNLRGFSEPMDRLAPKLIRRAKDKNYIAIVIDPIYKILTGDENSADQMAMFCNQFDKVCNELNCAVIYCHHHSKGAQGNKKSADRSSGSGVFARDPDAIIDIIELELSEAVRIAKENIEICNALKSYLDKLGAGGDIGQDDRLSRTRMKEICKERLCTADYNKALMIISNIEKAEKGKSAWRIEGTLREFERFEPVDVWFDYPIHKVDDTGVLTDCETGEKSNNSKGSKWGQNFAKKRSPEERKKELMESFDRAFEVINEDGKADIKDLAGFLGTSPKTIKRRIAESKKYWLENGICGKKEG